MALQMMKDEDCINIILCLRVLHAAIWPITVGTGKLARASITAIKPCSSK